jgi:guanine nucleotide-binding protein subunit alpha
MFNKGLMYPFVGTGESGKSTLTKQFHMLYIGEIKEEERKKYKISIFSNIMEAIFVIIKLMLDGQLEFTKPENKVCLYITEISLTFIPSRILLYLYIMSHSLL